MKPLKEWIEEEVNPAKKKGLRYLSEQYFHRIENRSLTIDNKYFFSPADGVILGAFENIKAEESIIQVKGVHLSLRDIMQDEFLEGNYLIVSIFMSFYDQHANYIPYSGYRTYQEVGPLESLNKPMLKIEQDLLNSVVNPEFQEEYLRKNGREISTINAPKLGQDYYVIRVGDYDVDTFTNVSHSDGSESMAVQQNQRFGSITYGSQCIFAIEQTEDPQLPKYFLRKGIEVGVHVKCREDIIAEIEF